MDLLEDDIDQLSDDEIEMQWEYNVVNPRSPRIDEDVK
jgi:GTP-binding protein